MKTRKHGNGMMHKDVVRFSNRLASQGQYRDFPCPSSDFNDGYERGWSAACRYFAHALRVKLREVESISL